MSLSVAVLAGGLATRLRPLTERIPKILLEVAGRPFAEHQIELLKAQGTGHVVFCVGHLGEQVEQALGNGRRWDMTFQYIYDGPAPAGTGGAVRRALPLLGESFFVMYGDSYLPCDFGEIERAFDLSGSLGLMTLFNNDGRWDRSNVRFESGRILEYDKHSRDASMRHIDYGLAMLTREAFAPWMGGSSPLDLETVFRQLIARGELAGHEVAQRFYEIGSYAGLEETRAFLEGREATT